MKDLILVDWYLFGSSIFEVKVAWNHRFSSMFNQNFRKIRSSKKFSPAAGWNRGLKTRTPVPEVPSRTPPMSAICKKLAVWNRYQCRGAAGGASRNALGEPSIQTWLSATSQLLDKHAASLDLFARKSPRSLRDLAEKRALSARRLFLWMVGV